MQPSHSCLTFSSHNLHPTPTNGANILKDMSEAMCDNASSRQLVLSLQQHNKVPSFLLMSATLAPLSKEKAEAKNKI